MVFELSMDFMYHLSMTELSEKMNGLLNTISHTPVVNTAFERTRKAIATQEWRETNRTVIGTYLGEVRMATEMSCRSMPMIHERVSMTADNVNDWLLIAGCLSSNGRFTDAAKACVEALKLDPTSAEARLGLSIIGQSDNIDDLLLIVNDPRQSEKKRITANFALGNVYDKSGQYDLAFSAIQSANELTHELLERSGHTFNADFLKGKIDDVIRTWTSDALTHDLGEPSELPVFIVGMPRSGTTLVEQIIASHTQAFGAGELSDMNRISAIFYNRIRKPGGLNSAFVKTHAQSQLSRLRTLGGSAQRITDKMPDNIFNVGAITLLFPKAKIILCQRDSRDVCVSCYFQNFGNMPWSVDLTSLGIRIRETERLVQHWRTVLPSPMLEVSYENLVTNPEPQSRRLIEFLGLDWEDKCLDFYKTDRQILTSSLWQVKQPMYHGSIGRWKNYPEIDWNMMVD
jgi:tetratricopeptide (TPR) repeat protein